MGLGQRLRNFFTGRPDKNISRIQMVTEYDGAYYTFACSDIIFS